MCAYILLFNHFTNYCFYVYFQLTIWLEKSFRIYILQSATSPENNVSTLYFHSRLKHNSKLLYCLCLMLLLQTPICCSRFDFKHSSQPMRQICNKGWGCCRISSTHATLGPYHHHTVTLCQPIELRKGGFYSLNSTLKHIQLLNVIDLLI